MRRPVVITVTSAAAVALLVVGAVVVYVQLLRDDAPPPLAIGDRASDVLDVTSPGPAPTGTATTGTATTATTAPGSSPAAAPPVTAPASPSTGAPAPVELAGTWTATTECVVGYRVVEDFVGGLQDAEAVGRTAAVTGTMHVAAGPAGGGGGGVTVTAAEFTVDVSTLRSDDRRRDRQVHDRLLDTATWPSASFALTAPLELPGGLAEGDQVVATATGVLTLRDRTRPVTVEVTAMRQGDEVQILGGIEIVFAEWGIPAPDSPIVSVRDHGTLEFSLWLTRTGP